ncbi:HNH endonuclease [Aeromonas hydrophila]|uniref:HNH endonuclease n=1 Tax=Aeromonas hydrophila TaxID=644 RepID=UPI0022560023|nr:HNH endonuclease [Aeromonas hydrophila]MCX4102898.1 HNH endonuclease [Aeromonas hydrophila]
MKVCIYCRERKEPSEFSLEHILPQFIGGATAPDYLKTRQVCKKCNNNLGLFVDASFEKDWIVHNQLKAAAHAFFDPKEPTGLPFICMGNSTLKPPEMLTDEVCELWLGPLGERVYWIRPADSNLFWYTGGNPRTVKEKHSRAYFIFSERSNKNLLLSWLSFRDCFEGRKIKKVLCSKIEGADPADIGFSDADPLDKERIKYFFESIKKNDNNEKGHVSMYINYDIRFMAKTAIGIAYSLFGDRFLETSYSKELTKALWHRREDEIPDIKFNRCIAKDNTTLSDVLSSPNAVTLSVIPNPVGIALNFNISAQLNWVVQILLSEEVTDYERSRVGDGFVVILFKSLKKCIVLDYPEFIAYKFGDIKNKELDDIYAKMNENKDYFKNL